MATKTERVNVWLTPEQVEWLKTKENVSETLRALVTEAMNLDRLIASVKPLAASKKKAPAVKKPIAVKKPTAVENAPAAKKAAGARKR